MTLASLQQSSRNQPKQATNDMQSIVNQHQSNEYPWIAILEVHLQGHLSNRTSLRSSRFRFLQAKRGKRARALGKKEQNK